MPASHLSAGGSRGTEQLRQADILRRGFRRLGGFSFRWLGRGLVQIFLQEDNGGAAAQTGRAIIQVDGGGCGAISRSSGFGCASARASHVVRVRYLNHAPNEGDRQQQRDASQDQGKGAS